jgi:lipopolysaccharide transport system permease protein
MSDMSENPPANVFANSGLTDGSWTTRITPHQGWLDWRLKQLWRYRDLISLFVWRDFVSAYKQTILAGV